MQTKIYTLHGGPLIFTQNEWMDENASPCAPNFLTQSERALTRFDLCAAKCEIAIMIGLNALNCKIPSLYAYSHA